MNGLHDLEVLIASRTPLIVVETRDEEHVKSLFIRTGMKNRLPVSRWTAADGLRRLDLALDSQQLLREPAEVLNHINAQRQDGLFLLLDFHPYLGDPVLVRLLRDIAQGYAQAARTVVLVSPQIELPAELTHLAARMPLALPSAQDIRDILLEEVRVWNQAHPQQRLTASAPEIVERLVSALAGLSRGEVRRLAASVIHRDGALSDHDLPAVIKAKHELLGQDGALTLELDSASMSEVAGFQRLKKWLALRQKVFLAEPPPPGLDPPKGILLLGVQGAGKSLAAKACAGLFGVPLLRLDVGALYNKYHGETERNLRTALKTAEVMAPCVLWMDEIEKGLAPDGEDGGVSRRVLGALLTWMAERRARVFLAATANDISALPPELLRKGRFDEIFFVDLPGPAERAAIFGIHLRRRGQDAARFNLDVLAVATDGFSGAEIEQAVVAALYNAHAGGGELRQAHLAHELRHTRPLSVLMAERIAELRAWARDRTVPA
jgi:AAA+ superfamily predicted ATPase